MQPMRIWIHERAIQEMNSNVQCKTICITQGTEDLRRLLYLAGKHVYIASDAVIGNDHAFLLEIPGPG